MSGAPVSVIIPTYNRAALVVQSVESVLAAIAAGDEVIVIDDGSTDHTVQALSPYQSAIRYLRVPNGGVGAARNRGIREAKHDLVAFNDSDDLWLPDRLALQRQIMASRPDVVYCFSNFGGLLANGDRVGNALGSWLAEFGGPASATWAESLGCNVAFSEVGALPAGHADFRVHIGNLYPAELGFNHVAAFTVLARRNVAGAAMSFPEDISWGEDWQCFARLSKLGPVAYLDCETALQRVHTGERLTAIDRSAKAAIQLIILQRVWGSDLEFLSENRSQYDAAVRNTHLMRARALLVQGRTVEAQEDLQQAGDIPAAYRALAHLPGGMVRGLLRARRTLNGVRATLESKSWRAVKTSMATGKNEGAKSSPKAARKVVAL
jgi:hypothetical protein